MTKTMHSFLCPPLSYLRVLHIRKAKTETAPVTMETINEPSFSIYIATAYQKWLTEKFCEITVFEKETYNCQVHC